jgi:hypothetical protein
MMKGNRTEKLFIEQFFFRHVEIFNIQRSMFNSQGREKELRWAGLERIHEEEGEYRIIEQGLMNGITLEKLLYSSSNSDK